jgi:hypothetical protein
MAKIVSLSNTSEPTPKGGDGVFRLSRRGSVAAKTVHQLTPRSPGADVRPALGSTANPRPVRFWPPHRMTAITVRITVHAIHAACGAAPTETLPLDRAGLTGGNPFVRVLLGRLPWGPLRRSGALSERAPTGFDLFGIHTCALDRGPPDVV